MKMAAMNNTASDCSVIELRQYTLQPGRRDELIELFEREFIKTQQAVGLQVLGIFRDTERDDRFVWLRGFADMAARQRGLQAFYGGPVWQAHRSAANATMIDSSDVLLLRPLTALPALGDGGAVAAVHAWQAVICPLVGAPDDTLRAALQNSGVAWFETQTAANNFPALPVREGEQVLVGLARASAAPLALPDFLQRRLAAPAQVLHLLPTAQSPLR